MGNHDHAVSALAVRPLYIDGQWRQGSEGAWAEDVNPADGTVFARIAPAPAGPRCSPASARRCCSRPPR